MTTSNVKPTESERRAARRAERDEYTLNRQREWIRSRPTFEAPPIRRKAKPTRDELFEKANQTRQVIREEHKS